MLSQVFRGVWLVSLFGRAVIVHVVADEVHDGGDEVPELNLFGADSIQSIIQAPIMAATDNFTTSISSTTAITSTTTGVLEQNHLTPACNYPFELCSTRHKVEKESLLTRLSKKTGKWDTNHPRYRLLKSIDAYRSYARLQRAEVKRWREMYAYVPQSQKDLLENARRVVGYKKKLNHLEHLIDENAKLCEDIARVGLEYYDVTEKEIRDFVSVESKAGRGSERYSVVQGLKHFVRDWSLDGEGERGQAFPCVLEAVRVVKEEMRCQESEGPKGEEGDEKKLKVLLPGSGLGRLGHEVASLGDFEVTINEWSSYMILPYRYLEAQFSQQSNPTTFYPFIDSLSHHATNENLYRPVVLTHDSKFQNSEVLLIEGDFTTVFSDTGGNPQPQFDVIVTHFFIDTARNLMSYLTTIHALLRPGGAWINFGPLLYGTGPWVQLSLDEVILVSEHMGFEFEDLPTSGDGVEEHICGKPTFPDGAFGLGKVRGKYSGYQFDERALTKNAYIAQSWVARRK